MNDQLAAIAVPVLVTDFDHALAKLIAEHMRGLLEREPVLATYLGIHDQDHRLGDMSRAARLAGIEIERRYLADLESLDPAGLSEANRLELELAILSTRRSLFDDEVHRLWERRVTAGEEIGDAIFLLYVRDFAPLPDRLTTIAARLEGAPTALQVRDRLGDRTVALWLQLELEAVESLPGFLDVIVEAGRTAYGSAEGAWARLEAAAEGTKEALGDYAAWIGEQLPEAGDDFALGREQLDALVALRAFDGLTTDEILDIGSEQLSFHKAARAAAAAEIDPDAPESEVLARVKEDHPASFEDALAEYRDVMDRAREFIAREGIASLPSNAPLDVVPTPEYLRKVTPFAAYFAPAAFDLPRKGIYIVTPSVDDDDASAIREHNRASISNTSIHEAYPGHHLQLSAALERPTISRLLVDAPEFVEGWGMYSEQLMREHGFDASPKHRMMLATDAIWRACRIILDIRLHRGEIGVDDAIDFLIEHTGFERPNAAAEVHRYTSTPTYQLSYLLGKVLILRLRADEQRRLGSDFSLRRFHDALLWSGSIPVSFHRRLLAGEGGGPFMPGDVA